VDLIRIQVFPYSLP